MENPPGVRRAVRRLLSVPEKSGNVPDYRSKYSWNLKSTFGFVYSPFSLFST